MLSLLLSNLHHAVFALAELPSSQLLMVFRSLFLFLQNLHRAVVALVNLRRLVLSLFLRTITDATHHLPDKARANHLNRGLMTHAGLIHGR